jgi:hypothetical protein
MKQILTILLAVVVVLVGLSAAVARDTGSRDVIRLSDARFLDGEFYVSVEVINDQELAGLDIPLRFGQVGDPITLDRVEWTDRVADWDFKHAAIDNENKTVILGLISELTNIRPQADLKVAASLSNGVADLVFRVPEGYEVEFSTFTTSRPTHELTFIYNRYEAGVPHVESFTPAFEADVNFKAVALPTSFALSQNYPNPFNPSTSFALELPVASDYSVRIYNVAGQLVKTFDGHGEAGVVTITWDGTSNQGTSVASGMYFYRAEAQSFRDTKRMLLLK